MCSNTIDRTVAELDSKLVEMRTENPTSESAQKLAECAAALVKARTIIQVRNATPENPSENICWAVSQEQDAVVSRYSRRFDDIGSSKREFDQIVHERERAKQNYTRLFDEQEMIKTQHEHEERLLATSWHSMVRSRMLYC